MEYDSHGSEYPGKAAKSFLRFFDSKAPGLVISSSYERVRRAEKRRVRRAEKRRVRRAGKRRVRPVFSPIP
jgi:hypothetical protein